MLSAVRQDKSKGQAKSSSYTVSFPSSVWALTQRQFLLKWGDREAFYTKTITNVSIALIVSSMFYNQPANTSGAFSRGGTSAVRTPLYFEVGVLKVLIVLAGALFFSLLFLGWLSKSPLRCSRQHKLQSNGHFASQTWPRSAKPCKADPSSLAIANLPSILQPQVSSVSD